LNLLSDSGSVFASNIEVQTINKSISSAVGGSARSPGSDCFNTSRYIIAQGIHLGGEIANKSTKILEVMPTLQL
jgi:hypothetical protein